MLRKILDEKSPKEIREDLVIIREYNEEKDKIRVEEMEKQCEIGQEGKSSLITISLDDPLGRIRHFSISIMLVATKGNNEEIIGVIRGYIKDATRGTKIGEFPIYIKLAYILGLRVSSMHRQKGVATKLVKKLEEWSKDNGAEYIYMMTDCANEPSINLFTHKLNYTKFHSPTVLVQPVHAHHKSITSTTVVIRLPPPLAESIYRRIYSGSEFFPKDIHSILSSKLHLGTYIAVPRRYLQSWDDILKGIPPCFAIMSVWNTKEVYQLQLKGVSKLTRTCCLGTRVLDGHMPWLRVPSIPNLFRPFGFYFLYGLHMEGTGCLSLMKSLCNFAHNMASDDVGCGAVVAEVTQWDPVSEAIPHWKSFSWSEDLWCMKKLSKFDQEGDCDSQPLDWIASQSSSSKLFVDPRDF